MKKGTIRGQISTEYLIVVGFVVFLVLVAVGTALFYTNQIKFSIKSDQIERYANNIITNSESVFYDGYPAQTTINAHLPEGVSSLVLSNQHLLINTTSGSVKAYKSKVPIEGILSSNSGVKRITIVAQVDKVVLTEG